jgi:hypothetical protein
MTWGAFILAALGLLLEALRSWRAIEPTLSTVADHETRIRALEEK